MIFKSTDYIEYISENIKIITEILEIKVDYNRVSSENMIHSKKDHLIIVVGYEFEKAIRLIELMESDKLTLIYDKLESQLTSKNKESNQNYTKLIHQMASAYDINTISISCNDSNAVCEKILNDVLCKDKNNLIIPMNNKITTIGVAKTAFQNQDIQLCYSVPNMYNYKNHSKTSEDVYVFNVNADLTIID